MHDINQVTDTWYQRFTFFDSYGLPSSSPQALVVLSHEIGVVLRLNSCWTGRC
jgi:hypothetical protein